MNKIKTMQDRIFNLLNEMETKEERTKREKIMEVERKNKRNELYTKIDKNTMKLRRRSTSLRRQCIRKNNIWKEILH